MAPSRRTVWAARAVLYAIAVGFGVGIGLVLTELLKRAFA